MNHLRAFFLEFFPASPTHSLISSIYGGVCISQKRARHSNVGVLYPRIDIFFIIKLHGNDNVYTLADTAGQS